MAKRYAQWIDAHRYAVLAAALMIAVGGGWLALQLPIRPDLSNLLPSGQKSVMHLRALQNRAQAFGTIYVVIEAEDPAQRNRAARSLRGLLRNLDPALVANIVFDDGAARRYFWKHRFLFVDLQDLVDARDALSDRIRGAKLKANPLYIDLEDPEDPEELDDRLEKLRRRFDEARAAAKAPAGFVSDRGTLQVIILRTTFGSSQLGNSERVIRAVDEQIDVLRADMPNVTFGMTGNLVMSVDENRAVMRGLFTAATITILICAIALLAYYRSVLPVLASLWSLTVGTLATFGVAKLAIGHLNLVTAFLAAIVVGNGVNAGLILLARYFEEIRDGREGTDALGRAIAGAARGTLAASLTAGVAYGSLILTDFRGFRHFGIIGGVGMALCWISAFTVLPAGLSLLSGAGRIRANKTPTLGRVLARLVPDRLGVVVAAGAVLTLVSAGATAMYVLSNPLQEDWSNLRPKGSETSEAVALNRRMKKAMKGTIGRGLTQSFAIGLNEREHVAPLVALLRSVDDGVPEDQHLMDSARSLDDLVPVDQARKLELLVEIRELLDDDIVAEFDEDDRKTLERVRPPPVIQTLTDADVPDELGWPFTEKDGTRGRLILATASLRFKTWNIRHRMEFSERFRALDLPGGAVVGGQSFIFADMVAAMSNDGPIATLAALVGAMLVVFLLVGVGRHAAVTLACAGAGVLGMIALVSAVGLEVNVIDFIALPITIGLGIDYAVNIAARARQEDTADARRLLRTTGGAVMLCSFTTIVGYGSLLLSDSGGIRSFGLAAILGEFTCLVAALILAPSLLTRARRRV